MPVLASINLNKRMNSQRTRPRLGRWLDANRVQFLYVQEPWRSRTGAEAVFRGWSPVGGSDKVFSWIDSRLEIPKHELIDEFWQRIQLGYLVIYNVYLDAYQQTARASQLERIRRGIIGEKDHPVLVVGDFNIAPNPSDGFDGSEISAFNSEVDREPLRQLLLQGQLVDLGTSSRAPQWTIERNLRGKKVQFRCDLALTSNYIANSLEFRCDASTRVGESGFTDHSALLIDVPVTIPETDLQIELFPRDPINSAPKSAFRFNPAKTAIHRKGPSPIARRLLALCGEERGISSVLDYGCGYGEDVKYYRESGLHAEGYDPHPPFGWSAAPKGVFDLVTVVFVLNVLPDPWARLKVLQDAAEYLSPRGIMVVVTRSESEVRLAAKKGAWPPFNDGYWSHEGKGTFQRGLDRNEILTLARLASLVLSPEDHRLTPSPGTTCVVLRRS